MRNLLIFVLGGVGLLWLVCVAEAAIEPSPRGDLRHDSSRDGAANRALGEPSSQPSDVAVVTDSDSDDDGEEAGDDDDGHVDDGEAESAGAASQPVGPNFNRYTTDIDDASLEKAFAKAVESLGTISVGFTDSGRLINGEKLECDESCEVVVPTYAYGAHEVVQAVLKAAQAVKAAYPTTAPLRVNHIGAKNGGYLRPHRSHQSGRDVDLGFYYKNDAGPGSFRGQRVKFMDLGRNWVLLRTLIIEADVQVILVDKAVQNALYDYALSMGEDQAWLDAIFRAGKDSKVQHAKRHKDHFHARLFAPRSQELGRRVQPILNKRPEENIIGYRIRNGDNLGKIAKKHGVTVAMIQKANGMRKTQIRAGRTLRIPLRGPCTHCPIPPPLVLPPRCLPPVASAASAPSASPSL